MTEPLLLEPHTVHAPRAHARPPAAAVALVLAVAGCVFTDPLTNGLSAWVFVALMLSVVLWALRAPGAHTPDDDPPRWAPARASDTDPALQAVGPEPPALVLPGHAPPPGLRMMLREGVVLGTIGFGGGLAVLAQIERRLSERRRWIPADTFLESAALGQSLPGAVAFNALGFIGFRLAGVPGAMALGAGFVLPSFIALLVFALAYPHLRHFRVVEGMFAALTPAVVGLVAATALRLGGRVVMTRSGEPAGWKGLLSDRWATLVMLSAGIAVAFLGVGVIEAVIAAGLLGIGRELAPHPIERGRRFLDAAEVRWRWLRWRAWVAAHREEYGDRRPWWRRRIDVDELPALLPLAALSFTGFYQSVQLLGSLAGIFMRAGALTFGGGFVMIPLLEQELVQARHWLTPQAFADAMALGQITPGPVVITATFIGYTTAGLAGALLSTVAVFLPSFGMVLLVSSSMERFRTTLTVQAFLDGIQPAVVGLMMAAAISLARNGITDWPGAALAAIAFVLLVRWRLNPMWVVLGAALLGLVETGLHLLIDFLRR